MRDSLTPDEEEVGPLAGLTADAVVPGVAAEEGVAKSPMPPLVSAGINLKVIVLAALCCKKGEENWEMSCQVSRFSLPEWPGRHLACVPRRRFR